MMIYAGVEIVGYIFYSKDKLEKEEEGVTSLIVPDTEEEKEDSSKINIKDVEEVKEEPKKKRKTTKEKKDK